VSAASLDPQEALRRQRIVVNCLRPHLLPEELVAALEVWERYYSHKRDFAWGQYLSVIDASLDDKKRFAIRELFLVTMCESLQDPGEGLPESSLAQGGANASVARSQAGPTAKDTSSSPIEAEKTTAALAGFNALLEAVGEQVSRQKAGAAGRMRKALKAALPALGLGAQKTRQMSEWYDTWDQGLPNPCNVGIFIPEMSTVIHSIYKWACEEFGPVVTDHMFGQALRRADNIPEAGTFPPRKLL
jgi:hypothetical protein